MTGPTPTSQLSFELGLALDGTALAIVWREPGAESALRTATVACDATPPSIALGVAELAHRAPAARRVTIVLQRPLGQTRTVRLPRMARAVAESVLARDWSRHVIGLRATPHECSAHELARGQWQAAFAPADVLHALALAAEEQGWSDVELRATDDALATAARALGRATKSASQQAAADGAIVCDERGPTDALCVAPGAAPLGRRFLAGATNDDAITFLDRAEPNQTSRRGRGFIVFGAPDRARALARTLGAQGHRALHVELGLPSDASSLACIAAAAMHARAALPLAAPSMRAGNVEAARRLTRRFVLATVAALVVAFALARQETRQALIAVERQRADLAGQVRTALGARSALEDASDVATALAEREGRASHASVVAAAVATALPRSAALTALVVAGDSVLIEGESPRSAEVYDALRGVPILERVRLAAPLRQERLGGAGVPVERFAFSAHVRRRPAGAALPTSAMPTAATAGGPSSAAVTSSMRPAP